jgi:transposase InsO family protein
VLLMGLRKQHQRSAAGTVLLYAMLEALRRSMYGAGLKHVELGWILEDNLSMRRVIEDIGGRAYKTYRIYEKAIA